MKKMLIYIVLLLLAAASPGHSQSISVTGAWERTLSSGDLQDGPGSDLVATYTSETNAAYLDITVPNNGWKWQVRISMSTATWPAGAQLWVHRTGNGIGNRGSISDGTAWQQVTTAGLYFFSGIHQRLDVPVQYQIRNVSATLPADAFSALVVYTLEAR